MFPYLFPLVSTSLPPSLSHPSRWSQSTELISLHPGISRERCVGRSVGNTWPAERAFAGQLIVFVLCQPCGITQLIVFPHHFMTGASYRAGLWESTSPVLSAKAERGNVTTPPSAAPRSLLGAAEFLSHQAPVGASKARGLAW